MRSWNYKLLCGAVCLAQLACLSLARMGSTKFGGVHPADHPAAAA